MAIEWRRLTGVPKSNRKPSYEVIVGVVQSFSPSKVPVGHHFSGSGRLRLIANLRAMIRDGNRPVTQYLGLVTGTLRIVIPFAILPL